MELRAERIKAKQKYIDKLNMALLHRAIKRKQQSLVSMYAIHRAINQGRLKRPISCSVCGKSSIRIHGHHPDYKRPLRVVWCCASCHSKFTNQDKLKFIEAYKLKHPANF
jgi:hypothetical protein